ncbi:MAG: tRNA pseudouridine(38-40) synthase TruA, partial [Gammaproteobacteria bacterium]
VEYDGTTYHGWQRQDNVYSVQAELESAISQVANHAVEIVCAGRTDKGVHALQQVIHFDTAAIRSDYGWLMGVNRYLPSSIKVCWIRQVATDFHARFSATARRYAYVLFCQTTRPGVMRDYVTWVPKKPDIIAMREAATFFLGKHDFTSFRGKDCQAKTTIRTISQLDIVDKSPLLVIDIKANAFLHNMVRNIAGTLLTVGHGYRPPSWVQQVIAARDRTAASMTAPATGLHFLGVDYPECFNIPPLPAFIWFK